jgi:hypothetical protein
VKNISEVMINKQLFAIARPHYFRHSKSTDDSGEPVSRVDIKGAILDAIAAGQLLFAFPGVSALLFFLQQTTVLDLYLEDWSLEGVHWHRLARNEVFEAEGWTTI